MTRRALRPLAAIYTEGGEADAWLVAETPSEALDAVTRAIAAGFAFVELTLGNPPDEVDPDGVQWNGRPVYVRVDRITAIGPPLDTRNHHDH